MSPEKSGLFFCASARAHVTRLEEMQYNIRLTAGTLHGEALAGMEEVNRNAYTKGLYETSKDVVGDGVKPDENEVKRVLAKPWKGENFSERVWNDRDRLVEKLHEHLSVALLTGEAPDKTAQKLADDMGVSLAAAQRIVRTESAAFAQMGTMDAYKQMGVEAYEILGTVDKRTCDTCGDLDGVRVDMKDGIQGRTLPPFHPNCRCTTVPAIEEELPDLDDIEIEGDTPFDEWLKEYGGDLGVDTEGKTGDEIVEEIRQDNERAKGEGNAPKAPSEGEEPDTWRLPKSTLGSDDVAQQKKTGYNIESEHLRRTLGTDACRAIEEALDKRPEHIRKIFKHFEDKLRVADLCDNPRDMMFDPSRGGVILNINAIINGTNAHDPGDAALHEFGHMIDFLIGVEKTGRKTYASLGVLKSLQSSIESKGKEYIKGEQQRLKDQLKILKDDIALGDEGDELQYNFYWRLRNGLAFDKDGIRLERESDKDRFVPGYVPNKISVSEDQAITSLAKQVAEHTKGNTSLSSLSDIFDGVLNGRVQLYGGVGHGFKYWDDEPRLRSLDFLAEVFEANEESIKQIRQFFPDEAKSAEEFLISYAEELERRKN